MNIRKGDKVVCISSFTGVPKFGPKSVHHNPPREGEEFHVLETTIEQDGELYLILGEVTNTQKYRGANDVFNAKKFKRVGEVMKNEEVAEECIFIENVCLN